MPDSIIIGSEIELPVVKTISIKEQDFFIVDHEGSRVRVPMFDWQVSQPVPASIRCTLVSINEFGYCKFVQVPRQETIELIELVRPRKRTRIRKKPMEESSVSNSPMDFCAENVEMPAIVPVSEPSNYNYYLRQEECESIADWVGKTGGVKYRYLILLSLAKQLLIYHRTNRVYKELTPEVIKIENGKNGVPFVTIPQNKHLFSGYCNFYVHARYSAPEVVNHFLPNTPMSDCFTFSVMAHEILAFCHPFLHDGSSEEDAYKGKLSWVGLNNDRKKKSKSYSLVTPEIYDLFKRTFIDGQSDIMARPSMYEWVDVLQHEVDSCDMRDPTKTFFIRLCLCYLSPKYAFENEVYNEDLLVDNEPIQEFLVGFDSPVILSTDHFRHATCNCQEILKISILEKKDDGEVKACLEPLDGYMFYASNLQKKLYSQRVDKRTIISSSPGSEKPLILSLQPLDIPQRVLIIQLISKNARH